MGPRRCLLAFAVLIAGLGVTAGAQAAQMPRTIYTPKTAPGVQHLHYKFGPIHIAPGQNTINLAPNSQRPKVPGFITRFVPNLQRTDGSTPRVDVLHLHHGVWLVNGRPTFAAGEEKTTVNVPAGFGYDYKPSDSWVMNYMIHDLTPNPDNVYITYDIDFIPASAPEAASITPVHTQWMDVEGGKAYPVFDAKRALGNAAGRFTYPDDKPYIQSRRGTNTWTVDHDATIVQTAGHLHPGGLETFLTITRDGVTRRLFTSRAKYYEPAGAVSWDVSMGTTPPNWKVAVKQGDILGVHGTYDVSKASWYESMAIMPMAVTDAPAGGVDPFVVKTDVRGVLTHGHLAENDHHGGGPLGLPDPVKLLGGPVATKMITIDGFVTSQGDLSGAGLPARPPVVRRGQSIRYFNVDDQRNIQHTITACRLPCNRDSGIAYPRADGPVDFDSGVLGTGPRGLTAAANRKTWDTPDDLQDGTYSYFCRIHPFMRGSFRVTG